MAKDLGDASHLYFNITTTEKIDTQRNGDSLVVMSLTVPESISVPARTFITSLKRKQTGPYALYP